MSDQRNYEWDDLPDADKIASLEQDLKGAQGYIRGLERVIESMDIIHQEQTKRIQEVVRQRDELRRDLAMLPANWSEDSSLATWFPFTALSLKHQEAMIAEQKATIQELVVERDSATAWGNGWRDKFRPLRTTLEKCAEALELMLQYHGMMSHAGVKASGEALSLAVAELESTKG